MPDARGSFHVRCDHDFEKRVVLNPRRMDLSKIDDRFGDQVVLAKVAKLCGIKWLPASSGFRFFGLEITCTPCRLQLLSPLLCTEYCAGCWFGIQRRQPDQKNKVTIPVDQVFCAQFKKSSGEQHSGVHVCRDCREMWDQRRSYKSFAIR